MKEQKQTRSYQRPIPLIKDGVDVFIAACVVVSALGTLGSLLIAIFL